VNFGPPLDLDASLMGRPVLEEKGEDDDDEIEDRPITPPRTGAN
jgi:hypothetical protein